MIDIAFKLGLGAVVISPEINLPLPGLTAIFGPSGSGKTSLLNAIAGLVKPESGYINIAGSVLFDAEAGIDIAVEKRCIGYVFQDARLFPHMTVLANLNYGKKRTIQTKAIVQPDTVIELLGIGHLLNRKPATLSGGEKQRVAIGRALLANPCLLLLDEPMSSLDNPRRQELISYLQSLRASVSVPIMLVSHNRDDVLALAENLVLMDHGRVTACGQLATVMPTLKQSRAADDLEPAVIIDGRVARHDDTKQTTIVSFDGGVLSVPRVDFLPGTRIRLRVPIRDVVIAKRHLVDISITNQLPGVIESIVSNKDGTCGVHAKVGNTIFIAQLMTNSVSRLALKPSSNIVVLVKAVTLDEHNVMGQR